MLKPLLILSYLFCLYTLISSKVVISEVCTHTDEPYYDYIELYNDGKSSEDISSWYLSDDRQPRTKLKIKKNTVLSPGQYKTFDVLKEGGFRMSKQQATIYLANKDVTVVDQVEVLSQTNHLSQSRFKNSIGDIDHPMTFTTENFGDRYPIVGPFVIDEVLLFPETGKQQYVKITCIRGTKFDLRKDVNNEEYTVSMKPFNGQAQMTTRENGGYELRFKQHKEVLASTTKTTTPAFKIPYTTILKYLESIYIVSGDPAKFAAEMNVPRASVFGPWNGKIDTTNGDRIALYADEGADVAHLFEVEKIKWKPESPWPTRNGQNSFGIKRRSLSSYANEPKNWKPFSEKDQTCSKDSDCTSSIDSCTSGICISGKCQYTALNCENPNYSKCYPSNFCLDPKVYGTCTISSAIFGHTGWWGSPDLDIFGWYKDKNNNDQMYWVAACPFRSIPGNSGNTGNTGGNTGNSHPTATCVADNRGDGAFNQNCIFPFVYQEQEYQECTTAGWGRLWCATEIDENSNAASFGACQCSMNAAEDENSELDSDTENTSVENSSEEKSSEGMSFGAYIGIGVAIGVVSAIFLIFFARLLKSRKAESV